MPAASRCSGSPRPRAAEALEAIVARLDPCSWTLVAFPSTVPIRPAGLEPAGFLSRDSIHVHGLSSLSPRPSQYARQDSNLQAFCRATRSMFMDSRRFPLDRPSTPGRTRTCNPRFRSLRRGNFADAEDATKSTFSRCPAMTSDSRTDFARVASFTAQRAKKAVDLRNPQTCFPGSPRLPVWVQTPGQQANPPPRHPTSNQATA